MRRPARRATEQSPGPPQPVRVLLIEDDPDDQFIVRDLLSSLPNDEFALDVRSDADSGWDALVDGAYDACLLDHFLGGTSGMELLRRARARGVTTPIIMLTGADDEAIDRQARAAGATDFLEKGRIEAHTLRRALHYAVARHAAEYQMRFQSHLLDSVREAIFAVDLQGQILYWNRFAAQLYGWPSDEAVGRNMHEVAPRQAEHLDADVVRETLRRGDPWSDEFEVLRRDGSAFWASVLDSPIFNEQGDLVAIIGVSTDVTERRAAIQEVRDSEERLKILFEAAPDAIFLTDLNGTIVDGNRMGEVLTGYPREELIGQSFVTAGLLAQKDVIRALATLGRIARGETPGTMEYDIRRRDGSLVPVELRTFPVDLHGKRLVIGIARDLTERQRAEAALRESEQRFRALVEHIPVGVWQLDADGFTLHANPAMCDLLEVPDQAALVGQHFDVFFARTSRQTIERELIKRMRGISGTYEADLVGLAGTPRRVLISGAALMGADGKYRGVIGAFLDITERQKAARALQESQQKFATAFQASPRPMAILTPAFQFLEVNDAFVSTFGTPRETIIGKGVNEIDLWVDPEERDRAHADVERYGRVRDREATMRSATGELRTGLYSAQIIESGSGRHVFGQFDDLTEVRQLQEELAQAQKMESIGRLAGGVAHDFNNILTAILGNADLLLADLPKDSPVRVDVEEIRDGAKRAAALTSQLLAFSRKQVMVPKVLDLNALVREMERMLRRLIGEDVELRTELDPSLGMIEADPGQLQQIIMNLAVNARDAMPDGGQLTIATANATFAPTVARIEPEIPDGDYVKMTVRDSGHGMPPEVQSQIFEPFFTTKEQGKGTGLGLSTVYGIVKQSAGHIEVESEVGHGTAFHVWMPRVDKPASDAGSAERSERVEGHETILLVEDDSSVRSLSSRILTSFGYDVLEARDAEDAEQLCARHADRIALLLTDVIMPGESGPRIAERVHRHAPNLPVLYMSGYTGEEIAHHGVLGSDVPFIQKPFTPHALAAKVRELLDAR